MSIEIKGIPEGMRPVRFGIAEPDEYEVVNSSDGGIDICKGTRPASSCQIIVVPAEGWQFVPRYDVKAFEERYVAARAIEPVDVTVKFRVTNTYEQECVGKVVANLKAIPGYVAE